MLLNGSVKTPIRCAVIGIGTMGKKYAAMIDSGEIDGLSLAAVCCRSDANAAWARASLSESVSSWTGEDGSKTLSLVNAAYLSAWQGRKVALPVDMDEYNSLLQEKIKAEETL